MRKVFLYLFLGLFLISFASAFNFETNGVKIIEPIDSHTGGVEISVQDQHTPIVAVYMNTVEGNDSLAANFSIDDYNITLNNATGVSVNDYIGVFSIPNNRYYAGIVLAVNGNVLTMDTPSDFNYTVGDRFQYGNRNMNVDGSVTPVIYSLRADPGLDFTVDVTRIIMHIIDQTAMDDEKFGGITKLSRGVVLRRVDGNYQNIFNIKSNGEIGELAFDKTYDDKAPSGFYGFSSRLTFAGQEKMGVTIRLDADEDLQVIIQDDLTELDTFRIMVEGHLVTNGV